MLLESFQITPAACLFDDRPSYLKTKEAAIQWMRSHGYRFSEMKSEYNNDMK